MLIFAIILLLFQSTTDHHIMSRLSSRLHELKSCIDDQTKQLLKMQIDLNYHEYTVMLLRQYEPLKQKQISENEIIQIIDSLKKPQIPKQKNVQPYHQLKKKADKILIKQYALKNIEIFKHRKNMGTKALQYMAIGREINELHLSKCDEKDITSATRTMYNIQRELPKCKDVIRKEDTGLLLLNVEEFYKQIRKKNYKKMELANKKNRNKKTIHLKSKKHKKNQKSKKKKSKNQNAPQICNDISKLTRCKYSQLVDYRLKLSEMKYVLNEHKTELKEAAINIGILDANNKCQQETQWKSLFDNELTIAFRGKKAFERVKKLKQNINKLLKITHDNILKINILLNETVWKKYGNFKNTKSMMERVADYKLELKRKREKYLTKTNYGKCLNQLVMEMNKNIIVVKKKTKKTVLKRKKNNNNNDITNYFCPAFKKRRTNDNSIIENPSTTEGLNISEDDDDEDEDDVN